ncbi:MAG: tetratricopeptide repeat protein [Verrucomicrobiota bacterium]
MNKYPRIIRGLCLVSVIGFSSFFAAMSFAQDDEDVSVEALYQKAAEFSMAGDPVEASKTFERMFDLSGGTETLFEDYGAQAGGFFFDYGLTLIPQQRWDDAKKAFDTCVRAKEIAEEVESPINSTNARENLARFQLGRCEAELGNHGEAIRLYDEYINSEPPPEELRQVYASFKLSYGTSLLELGRIDEGIASMQELFDNATERSIPPQVLMQAVYRLGMALISQANAAGTDEVAIEKIANRIHEFLDKNQSQLGLSPFNKFRFGLVNGFRLLGLEATKAGLYTVALRVFGMIPTLEDVKRDIDLALTRLPVGAGVPSQYQQLLDRVAEMEKAPMPIDAENLRIVATCYEAIGNPRAARVIYRHLAEHFPDISDETRTEIFHEASRLSFMLGDFSAAQYFGEEFMAVAPEDSSLKENVSVFMLQSLFTAQEYEQVITVGGQIREQYELGDDQRELADFLYPLALYSLQRHEDAAEPFAEYVKGYPEGANLEAIMFHRASNSLILGKMRESAEQYEDFLKLFPDSEKFLANAYADLAIARFNLEDYPATIAASDSLEEKRPEAFQVGRTLNIEGDAYTVQAGNLTAQEQQEQKAEWEQASLDAYLAAFDVASAAMSSDPDREEFHKNVASEGLWKSASYYYDNEEVEKGLAQYDKFFPTYEGTPWEPQISVFSLEHLEGAGRGEEGLKQVEKMILFLGSKPPEEQDLTLLRQAIGSYAEASVRVRGVDATVATLDDFPGIDPENQGLLTWLKIQQVIVLQEAQKGMEKDSPDYAAAETRIAAVFEDLRLFEKRNLSEFALREVGRYFAGTDNPFLGVPYFEELLARTNPEADQFKGLAEMELGEIEMRSADPGKVQAARERFRRIIDKYKDPALVPQAYLNLAKLHIDNEEWRDALAALDVINKQKNYFKSEREKRAESGFLLGTVLDELGEPAEANQAYLAVVSTYGKFPDWITQAWERYIPNSVADFEKMPTTTPEEIAAKRQRELALYRLTRKFLYQWQNFTDEVAPSGALRRLRRDIEDMKTTMNITPEEEQQVLFELGLATEN